VEKIEPTANRTLKPTKATKWLSLGGTVLGVGLLVIAVWIFGRTLHRYDMDEVIDGLGKIPPHRLVLAGICAALSYLIQACYDYVGAASLRLGVSPLRSVMAAFIGNAFTNNIGFSLLTGTSLRYRFYLAWGSSTLEIAQVVVLAKLAFFNGLLVFTALTQILDPVNLPASISLPVSPRVMGGLLLLPVAALLFWNGMTKGRILKLGKMQILKPAQKTLIAQILVSCLHFAFAAFTLYFLLPQHALTLAGYGGPWAFLGPYMAIKLVVMVFPVPGSLGVWEGTAVAVLTPALPAYPVLGALVAYRLIYYVLPFAVALLIMAGYEISSRQGLLAALIGRRRQARRPA